MSEYVLEAKNLQKWFPLRKTFYDFFKGKRRWVKAVDGISFKIKKGEIFGFVGESGCGKTTTGRLVMKLVNPTGGQLLYNEKDVMEYKDSALIEYKKHVQMIFQDPYASMNPRFKIKNVLEEPLLIHKIGANKAEREKMMNRALSAVKLEPPQEFMERFPHMLSGGQRQRVATARTLILSPSLIVADEPVSMIDLSTRAEILHVMKQVQREMNLTYLYITHDISTARYFTDRIAVMYLGRIVEMGTSDDIIDNPLHPYTKALIAAVCEPLPGKVDKIKSIPISGEIPSASNIPTGCRFHPRCPYAKEICSQKAPLLEETSPNHFVECHLWKELEIKRSPNDKT